MIFTLCDYFKALKSDKHAAATLLLLMICQSFNGAVLQTTSQKCRVRCHESVQCFKPSPPVLLNVS